MKTVEGIFTSSILRLQANDSSKHCNAKRETAMPSGKLHNFLA